MVGETRMRVALITLGVTLCTAAVIGNAFYQKQQFYPSIVYLTKSNPSIAVLYAQGFALIFLLGKALRKIFFGQLRASEVEHLIEKFWYVITETCLAFTVFRDDFSPKFVALFTFLLFMKAFHWLVEDRVDYMERSPIITVLFHIRVNTLLLLLGTLDSALIHHAFKTTLSSGASVQMVFGFEYAILLVMVVAIIMKYVLHTIDYISEHPWENKNVYLLYAELITGLVKCCLYVAFVGVMVKIHTFPLFAIRPMYLTIRSFKKSLSDVILSRRAIAYMNTRFLNASEGELRQVDNTCIICREQMTAGKKLPCNHIFHAHCLRSWFQRQQSCPTCRMDVLSARAQTMQPPAQQQQQQQQPPAGMPRAGAPPFTGMPPPAGSPFGMPPGMPPGVLPQTSAATSQTTQASTNETTSPNFLFPVTMPPPSFMFGSPPSFLTPPPPPFMYLSTLSLEQLHQMEGQERENVESRVRLLRNVHSLLDSVIVQLNQYSQVVTTIGAMSSTNTANNESIPSPETATKSTTTISSLNDIISNETSTTAADVGTSSTPCNYVENITMQRDIDVDDKKNNDEGLQMSPDNELRRRRLERFQNIQNNTNEE
ncbi:E3 ubiquitin-protein ligase synoviolin B-like isoform X2 [Hydractinia symbiolongicarpus]|uniref:E3 ubiquitin-protein ligase synoviolin B-like isoform X2 n=1 Tax=Hydractinia symbiolongicarpus TaxID=13093 RepID=UPI00254F51F6|nr:E3 ubiquitin-protein ligase synoviolin B-like isoform X2 [Hydractinia symbiolongicarpus]